MKSLLGTTHLQRLWSIMSTLPIKGFSIGQFRSFSGGEQFVGPFQKINVLIGENNSGKSNVIRFIRNCYAPLVNGEKEKLRPDQPQGEFEPVNHMNILLPIDEATLGRTWKNLRSATEINQAKSVFASATPKDAPDGYAWFPISRKSPRALEIGQLKLDLVNQSYASNTWSRLSNSSGGSFEQHWIPQIYGNAIESLTPRIKVIFIPTLRRIPTRLAEYKDEYDPPGDGKTIVDEPPTPILPTLDRVTGKSSTLLKCSFNGC